MFGPVEPEPAAGKASLKIHCGGISWIAFRLKRGTLGP